MADTPAPSPIGKIGVRVICALCGQQKQPRGRSAALIASFCTRDDCAGYVDPPLVGDLWPGETDAQFGFPCGDDGTEPFVYETVAALAPPQEPALRIDSHLCGECGTPLVWITSHQGAVCVVCLKLSDDAADDKPEAADARLRQLQEEHEQLRRFARGYKEQADGVARECNELEADLKAAEAERDAALRSEAETKEWAERVVAWHRDMAARFAEDRDEKKRENRALITERDAALHQITALREAFQGKLADFRKRLTKAPVIHSAPAERSVVLAMSREYVSAALKGLEDWVAEAPIAAPAERGE